MITLILTLIQLKCSRWHSHLSFVKLLCIRHPYIFWNNSESYWSLCNRSHCILYCMLV